MSGRAHPRCWDEDAGAYVHVSCRRPSGRVCVESGCEGAAGTLWGPFWCPDCDVVRLDRVTADLEALVQATKDIHLPEGNVNDEWCNGSWYPRLP